MISNPPKDLFLRKHDFQDARVRLHVGEPKSSLEAVLAGKRYSKERVGGSQFCSGNCCSPLVTKGFEERKA